MLCAMEQVFIHDPLYKWALTPLGAQQRQKDDPMVADSSPAEPQSSASASAAAGMPPQADAVPGTDTTLANADAERALLRLKQKLAGMEGGKIVLEPAVTCLHRWLSLRHIQMLGVKILCIKISQWHLGYPVSSTQPGVEHDTLMFLCACFCVVLAGKFCCN